MSIAIYGGAYHSGCLDRDESHAISKCAVHLGKLLGGCGHDLITGACASGPTALLTTEALKHGGSVTGVVPHCLFRQDDIYQGIDIVWANDVMDRIVKYAELANGHIVLPGGIGTLHELISVLAAARLGGKIQPVLIVNIRGYFTPLLSLMDKMLLHGWRHDRYDNAAWDVISGESRTLSKDFDAWTRRNGFLLQGGE